MDNLCLGTAQFGMPYGIANKIGQPDEKEVESIIRKATENDIFFYDTASSYGKSEALLGIVFKKLNINKAVNVISKLSPDFIFSEYSLLKEKIQRHLDRLNISSLWGLLLHRPVIRGDEGQFFDAINKLKGEKVIKNFGVSIYDPKDAMRFLQQPAVDIIQVPFNILDRRLLDHGFFISARKMHKKVFIRSVFLQGLLLMDERALEKKKVQWAGPYLRVAQKYARSWNVSLKTFAIQAVLKLMEEEKIIIGVESEAQIEENIRLAGEETIADEIIENWWRQLPSYPEKLLNPSLW